MICDPPLGPGGRRELPRRGPARRDEAARSSPPAVALAPCLALCLALAPAAAAAQEGPLARPSIGDALRTMERLHALHAQHSGDLRQTFVAGERPGQNQVAWYDFAWQVGDVPSFSGGEGGLRLYAYARERAAVERALPVLREAYLRLVDAFHYTPTRRIPFILYASQREFQAGNVFQIAESTLGVTSPHDLKMALPAFADRALFRHVATHELAHQFTIQKLLDLGGGSAGSGLDALPLWLVEGLAEFYAFGGLDPETDLYLRDLVWNPDPRHHHELVSFADDDLRGYLPTYKLGQARVAFVAEVYGGGRIQELLEAAPLAGNGPRSFDGLVGRVLGEPLEEVDVRWRAWVRARCYPDYLRAREDLPWLREVREAPAEVESFTAAPGGRVVLFRGLDRDAGRARLYLMDTRFPSAAVEVAHDDAPGVESLHPVERGVTALSATTLAFAAQDGPGDVLYVQAWQLRPGEGEAPSKLTLGERRRLDVQPPGGGAFLEISDPAFSPDGRRLAFVGLPAGGDPDVFVVDAAGGVARQLTRDPYVERDLAWGEDGLLLASDATDHRKFNLFRLDPETGARTRLTTAPARDLHPQPWPGPGGGVLHTSDAAGKPDLYLLRGGADRRLTDFTTGLTAPSPGPPGQGALAITFHGGRFRLVEVPPAAWLEEPAVAVGAAGGPPEPIASEPLPAAPVDYSPWRWGSWRPEAGFVAGAGGTGEVAGRAAVLFADVLRDRLLFTDLAVLGSFERTQVLALLQDRSARAVWSAGAFHTVTSMVDAQHTDLSFAQREVGAVATLALPLDRFRRVELELSASGVERYCLTDFSVDQPIACGGGPLSDVAGPDWRRRNGGLSLQLGPAVRYGVDTVRLDPAVGPESGSSLLVELGGSFLPWRHAVSGYLRGDAERYWRLFSRSSVALRAAAAGSFAPGEPGRTWERIWWVSSADNLRGYAPFDLAYLVGTGYWVANLELQLPLDAVVRLPFLDALQGVAALDFGGVSSRWSGVPGADPRDPAREPGDLGWWQARTLTGVLGVNLVLGPILFRVHFGHPFDVGGIRTPALRSGSSWVTNVTLRYLFF